MNTSMMMTVTPPNAAGLRDGGEPQSFRHFNTDYPDLQRRQIDTGFRSIDPNRTEVPIDAKERTKKDKKWSIGKLFRRKKKEDDSGSSSESDEGISTKSETKKKSKKKKRPAPVSVNNFDHIVVNRDSRRAQSVIKQKSKDTVDEGVLSDPSAGFVGYRGRGLPHHQTYITSKESLHPREDSGTRSGNTSLDGSVRRGRKGRMKARVEAIRNSMRKDSSSDEESQKSSTSSSMIRFRSEDSLMNNSRDGSLNRKSRSARTERYIKRLSRDEENQLNKEAELLQQGYTKAEVEMLTRTPTSQSSGYGTCKRENPYANTKPENVYSNDQNLRPLKSESISSFPSTHSYPSSVNFNAKVNNDSVHYSIPYARNIASTEPMYANNCVNRRTERNSVIRDNVMCVKFPLGNVTNIGREDKAPPVPPPRDLQRKVATPVSMLLETEFNRNNRSVVEEKSAVHGVPNNDFQRIMRRSQERSLNSSVNGLRRPMSNSEDHIAMQNGDHTMYSNLRRNDQPRRPASVSAEPHHYGLYVNAPWRNKMENPPIVKPEPVKQDFLYYADQSPRSRRPISIHSSQNNSDKQYLSDSQASLNHFNNGDIIQRKPRNASEFWRKIDDDECIRKRQQSYPISRTMSEHSSSALQGRVSLPLVNVHPKLDHTNPKISQANDVGFLNNGNKLTLHNNSRDIDGSKKWKSATEYKRSLTTEVTKIPNPPQRTHLRQKSDTQIISPYKSPSEDEKNSERRKSTNLDDALNELEAIYNSLGLGDEDLLDRAERRELMSPKCKNSGFNDWNGNDDVELVSQPSTPLRRHAIPRRSTLPDRMGDDMAFRRMNSKEKASNKDQPTAQISYMLASPVYVPYAHDSEKHSDCDQEEPDIVQDDVVYRNIRHANNHLKLLEPQPPFGIPLGPVTPAPQSDYLHATPDNKMRSRFVPRRSPDLVSDDLAYRALRKDNRNTSLFSDGHDLTINNNHSYNESTYKESSASLRKKRAVRSLSANIFSMIQKEIDDALNMSKLATLQKAQSISDVNKGLQQTNGLIENHKEVCPRNKVKHRHNTVNIFVSDIHKPSLPFTRDDGFLNKDDKYLAKPPSGDKSKSSSPSNRSPQPAKRSSKDEFQQVLTMLAQEAMDTSNKLGVALAELDKNRHHSHNGESISDRQSSQEARAAFLSSLSHKNCSNEISPEVKLVKVYSEIIQDPKMEQTKIKLPENDNLKGQKTEDSLLAISDQLNKVEDKLKHSFEREINFSDESSKLSSYIVKAEEKIKAQECIIAAPEIKITPRIVSPKIQEDIVQVQNNSCELKIDSNVDVGPSVCPKHNEVKEMKSFSDLKEDITDLLAGITQVNEKLFKGNESKQMDSNKDGHSERNSVSISVYEDDLVCNKDMAQEATEYNSSEELATIFNLKEKNKEKDIQPSTNDNDKRPDLNSPRLVQSMNQQLRRFSVDCTDNEQPSQSGIVPTIPWRTKKHNSNSQQDEQKGEK